MYYITIHACMQAKLQYTSYVVDKITTFRSYTRALLIYQQTSRKLVHPTMRAKAMAAPYQGVHR